MGTIFLVSTNYMTLQRTNNCAVPRQKHLKMLQVTRQRDFKQCSEGEKPRSYVPLILAKHEGLFYN